MLKAAREKQSYLQRSYHKTISSFLKRNFVSKERLAGSIQSDEKQGPPRLLYPAKLSYRMEGQIKCFPNKVKLKEFIITKPVLREMLKGFIYEKEDLKNEH